ncbi:DNA-directed RNA polymerase III subunit RPC4-like [Diabrotica undecimpunctata]|uniref:DNA-directed RNA polymerase III subunit RPC4-like n=1 Tax=Diabrotica undecimpunctata TaxID=50387 RepID=UPI003B63BDAB
MVKEEAPTNTRLTSFKLPRDLTLAPKKTKKVFVPNLNAVRKKEIPKEFNKREDRNKNGGRERKQKPRDNTPKFVQSSGIFSEGVGADVIRIRSSEGRSDKENDVAPLLTMPTIKKNSFQVDQKNEDNVFKRITDCDEESDDEKLPFRPISWENKFQQSLYGKTNITNGIKSESLEPSLKKLKLEPSEYVNGVCVESHEFLIEDKYNHDMPSMSLWALPDSFAGKGLSDDPNCKKLFDFGLKNMQEGQIGKIIIRKSGKMEIQIGSTQYELIQGDCDYKEEAIAVDLISSKTKAKTAVMGNIEHRYFLAPDWDRLLQ